MVSFGNKISHTASFNEYSLGDDRFMTGRIFDGWTTAIRAFDRKPQRGGWEKGPETYPLEIHSAIVSVTDDPWIVADSAFLHRMGGRMLFVCVIAPSWIFFKALFATHLCCRLQFLPLRLIKFLRRLIFIGVVTFFGKSLLGNRFQKSWPGSMQ